MSLYQRGNTWWVYLVAANGQKIRRSTETSDKALAQKFHDVLKAEAIQTPHKLLKGECTFEQAGKRWLRESEHTRAPTESGRVCPTHWPQAAECAGTAMESGGLRAQHSMDSS